MIELKNVSKYYNNNGVVTLGLRNINLNFDKNEIVAIVGESGSGKSTLLNVICGVDSYEDGEILFDGYETSYFNQEDMDTFRRTKVSFIYQNYNIIDSYTVLENVMFPLLINGYNKKDAKKRALELIEKVGLSHRIKNRGVKLSGGEKQRCVIARALATDAPILACDEPTGNLDSKTGEDIIKLIKEVAEDKLVLIVTHNYEQVESIATRTITMSDGEVINDSNPNLNVTKEMQTGDIFEEKVKKLNYSTIATIGANNLRRTPKKNIFVFLVLFVLSIIAYFLFSESYVASLNARYNSHSGFNNDVKERVIVFDSNHKSFDSSIFSSYESYVNAFYEDKMINLRNNSMDLMINPLVTLSVHVPYNTKLKYGTNEIKDNEGYLVTPTNYYDSNTLDTLVKTNDAYIDNFNKSIKINVVGAGELDDIRYPILVVNEKFIYENNLINAFKGKVSLTGEDGQHVTYTITRTVETSYSNIDKPKLLLPDKESDYKEIYDIDLINDKMNKYAITIKLSDVDVQYDNDINNAYPVLELPYGYEKKECFELSVYTDNINRVKALAAANGLSVIVPSMSGMQILSFSFITFVVAVVFSSLIMLLLILITYAVLHKVYQSRRKDYAIMRSLGLMRPQMAKMIRFEVCVLGFLASVFAIITMAIVFMATSDSVDKNVVKATLSPLFLLLYFVLMFLFNLLLANRFNKKLFKFSITKTIKEVF